MYSIKIILFGGIILEEKTISSQYIYKGKILNLRKDNISLENGSTGTREIIEHNGGVGIVAITPDKKVVLVKQYRKPYDEELLEIPAGKLELNEEPEQCGRRELEEETGYIPKDMTLLTKTYPSPGYTNEILHIYFSKSLEMGHTNFDEGEHIELIEATYEDALSMINKGIIKDAKTIIGLLLAKQYL